MQNKSRRTFIKGATYATALTITGVASLSCLATASESHVNQNQTEATEIVTLINHTSAPVRIDNISEVAINELNDENMATIAPGAESSFIVPALSVKNGSANNKNLFITDVMAGGQLFIKSDHPEFNGIFPTSVFETQAA